MLHYKQGIMQVYFNSVSLGSDYRNALFVHVYGQQIMSLFLLFWLIYLAYHVTF